MLKSFATTVVTRRSARAARRGVAAEHLGEAVDLDGGREAVGVDLLDRRGEQHVDARGLGERGVARLVARVGGEILARRRTASG